MDIGHSGEDSSTCHRLDISHHFIVPEVLLHHLLQPLVLPQQDPCLKNTRTALVNKTIRHLHIPFELLLSTLNFLWNPDASTMHPHTAQVFAFRNRENLLPLYSVLQFLLNQPNSLKHISDVINSAFLHLESSNMKHVIVKRKLSAPGLG
jgi:hypothetical protein